MGLLKAVHFEREFTTEFSKCGKMSLGKEYPNHVQRNQKKCMFASAVHGCKKEVKIALPYSPCFVENSNAVQLSSQSEHSNYDQFAN